MAVFSGNGLGTRLARSSAWRVFHFGGAQMLRFASNLILTRLLFPEAFGLMALVTVVLVGLTMFSDTGIQTAILQNERGDDPKFLNTAWTIQVIRGGILWGLSWPIAWLMSVIYAAPIVMWLIPVAGLSLIAKGFTPTRFYTAQRHLAVGRISMIELLGAFLGVLITLCLAAWLQSVWALAIGMVISGIVLLLLQFGLLEGHRDRFQLDRDAAREILGFGKWILLSTGCAFLENQGDKLILGAYLTLETLGIYNIAYFLASVPFLLGQAVFKVVLVPYLRERPPADSRANFLAYRRVRLFAAGGLIVATITLALLGPYLIPVLYDSRYEAAGTIIVLICLSALPILICSGYAQVSLARGDSRRFSGVMVISSILKMTLIFIGVAYAGLAGALSLIHI